MGGAPELADAAGESRSPRSRPSLWAVLAGVVVLAVAAGAWLVAPVLGGEAPPVTASEASGTARPPAAATAPATPTEDPAALRLQALDTLLTSRAQAVLARDKAAWMATVDPAATDFAARQSAVFDHLAPVPLASWSYQFAGEGSALPPERLDVLGQDAWVAGVNLVYRLADADLADVRRAQHLTLVRRGDQWLVADDADGPTAAEPWDLGPVQVVRGERSLVLGSADVGALEALAAEADTAVVQVDGIWGEDWPRTVVLLAPATQTEMARLLQRPDETGLDQIAAVTTGEVNGGVAGTSADRVIVNPAGMAQLGDLGRRVVLAHEITHVATRATTTADVPIWLSEGFADYVGYAGTGVGRAVVAQDVLDLVRAGQGPAALPVEADFDPAQGTIAPAYSGAWLAADLIARVFSEDALIALYRAVATGTPVDAAVPGVLGTDLAGFQQRWQEYLAELAG